MSAGDAVTARDRTILRMFGEGEKIAVIAAAIGITDSAVSGVLSRARIRGLAVERRGKGPERTPQQEIAHLRFMAEWWGGLHCEWVRDPAKQAAVAAKLEAIRCAL